MRPTEQSLDQEEKDEIIDVQSVKLAADLESQAQATVIYSQ